MPSLVQLHSGKVEPCSEESGCSNSPRYAAGPGRCRDCRLAKAGGGLAMLWKPRSGAPLVHPRVILEKRQKEHDRQAARRVRIETRDLSRVRLLKQAVRAEAKTGENIIRATKNSGRVNQDGDHIARDRFLLDTKLQSTVINPQVALEQLDKIRAQARQQNYLAGALVLRNRHNRAVIVIAEEDFPLFVP